MVSLKVPTADEVDEICSSVCERLKSRFLIDEDSGEVSRNVCSACDRFTTLDNPREWMLSVDYAKFCRRSGAEIARLPSVYPDELVSQYRIEHALFRDVVVSPFTAFRENVNGDEEVLLCKECYVDAVEALKIINRKGRKKVPLPLRAIWNGNLIGKLPEELSDLTIAELAIVSPNRVMSHGIVLYAEQHKGVFGWHAMYENSVVENLSNINELIRNGLSGDLVCVLCGPFSKIQKRKAEWTMKVRWEKVKHAFRWLKQNNHFYKDFVMPRKEDMPRPTILFNDDL